MLYIKNSRAIKPKRKQFNISTFEGIECGTIENVLPLKYSPLSFNYKFNNGALTTGMGVEKAKFPMLYSDTLFHDAPVLSTTIVGLWFYRRYDQELAKRDDRIISQDINGDFYMTKLFESSTFVALNTLEVSGKVNCVNYRLNGQDVFLVSSEYGKLWVYDGVNVPYSIDDAPHITSMCVHYERIYATTGGEKNQVWFSDDFDPTNWNQSMTEGGFIEFSDDSGRANKVISFLDYIYVFRDFGINRLTAYGDQSDFVMAKLYNGTSRIYPDTVTICGSIVIFVADDGVYAFDGLNTKRILDNISSEFCNKDYAKACHYNGKYYLAIGMKFKDKKSIMSEKVTSNLRNVLVEFDITTGIVNVLRGANVNCLLPVNIRRYSKLLGGFGGTNERFVSCLNEEGNFHGKAFPKYWRTSLSDLGHKGQKVIREMYINTEEEVLISIIKDDDTLFYFVKGGNRISKIKVNERGEQFAFAIESSLSKAYIHSPSIVVDYI